MKEEKKHPRKESKGEGSRRETGTRKAAPSVCAIVLNYNAPLQTMARCLDSLARQTYKNARVLLVDNASSDDIIPEISRKYPDVEILPLERNYGFSGGINRGVAHADADYVFLLNFDTVLEPDCIEAAVAVAAQDAAGVAPKIMLAGQNKVFDSVGIGIEEGAGAFQQGLGQPDVGQYDVSEQVFGVCFGGALIRRDAFDDSRVGPLDEGYFMFFEDVDWSYRANLLGYKFRTAPAAVIHHEHSASVKGRGYNYKYRLIQVNLLKTVLKNYQRRLMVKVIYRRLLKQVENALVPGAASVGETGSWSIIGRFLLEAPRLLPRRWEVQRHRQITDADIMKLSFGEMTFFDVVNYQPIYSLEALAAAHRRLYAVAGEQSAFDICRELEMLGQSKLKYDQAIVSKRLEQILAGRPPHVLDFAAKVKAG